MLTRVSGLHADREDGLARWKHVPRRIRAWIVFDEWTRSVRRRLLPTLAPDSLVFQIQFVARTLRSELRSLVARIQLQFGSRTQLHEMTDLPYFQVESAGSLTLNLRSHACSAGIAAMLARYPALTLYDELMYLEGWSRAEQWLLYTTSNAGKERFLTSLNLPYEDDVLAAYDRMISECWPQSARQKAS